MPLSFCYSLLHYCYIITAFHLPNKCDKICVTLLSDGDGGLPLTLTGDDDVFESRSSFNRKCYVSIIIGWVEVFKEI